MKLGEILVQKGMITQQQLDAALSVKGDEQVGQLLIQWGFITQEQLLQALDIQAPPPPPPPPQPVYQPPIAPQPNTGPDLTMDTLQTSKFKMDLKTIIYVGSILVSAITMYFTFMAELDDRFDALEDNDKDGLITLEKKFTELENKFTPIGDGVYSVDPGTTWPPGRQEYQMKQTMNASILGEIQKDIEDIKKDIEKIEKKVFNGN